MGDVGEVDGLDWSGREEFVGGMLFSRMNEGKYLRRSDVKCCEGWRVKRKGKMVRDGRGEELRGSEERNE